MRHTAQITHHHAKTVVEWHGNAELILVGKVLQTGYKIAVVQNVVMAQGRTLGEAGRTARVLNIDRVIELLLALPFAQLVIAYCIAHRQYLIPGKHTGNLL